jgi:hypothetical protein
MVKLLRLDENYVVGANPDEENALDLDTQMLDELVELVGSEEEVEAAAKEAHEDLVAAFERNEVEIDEYAVPEKLAIASLILKLVEQGKIGPEDADQFIADNVG